MATYATLDTVLHSTLTKSLSNLMLASLKSNALHAWAFARNRIDYEDGGHEISNPLITGRNPNVGTYSYYDEVPVGQTDEFDTTTYKWSRFAGTVIISDQEQDENRGRSRVFKLMNGKMKALQQSIEDKFSEYLYGAGAGSDPLGLAVHIPLDPTTGIIGTHDRSTSTWARTSAYITAGSLDSTTIEEQFDDIMLDLKLKSDKPDVILVGRNIWRLYKAAVRDKVVLNLSDTADGSRMADLGFTGMSHEGVTMLYDEDCPVDRAYFINSKYLRLTVLRHVNMRVKKLTAPWDTDAVGRRLVWQGQYCNWNFYRKHAVLDNSS